MTDKEILVLIKKSMEKHQGRTKWWQVKKVYQSYRGISYSHRDSVREILYWWWRLFPLSKWGRMGQQLNRMERDIADNQLYEIKEIFNLDAPLYNMVKALKEWKEENEKNEK